MTNLIRQFVFNKNILVIFFTGFGVVHAFNEAIKFYLGNFELIAKFLNFFQEKSLFLLAGIFIYALIRNYNEIKAIKCKTNSDFELEIKIGNIYKEKGSLIIGSGSTFDTSCNVSKNSLIGKFIKKYYKNKTEHLDNIIKKSLNRYSYVNLEDGRKGKKKRYKLGTVAQVPFKNNRRAYLLALNDTNIDGNAEALPFSKLEEILNELWRYIPKHKLDFDEQIVIPLLGTKFCGINKSKKEIINLILKTFANHSKENNICKKLTIVISFKDYLDSKIQLQDLLFLAEYICFKFDNTLTQYESILV